MPGVVQHTRDSLRKAAAEAAALRARRADALRRPARARTPPAPGRPTRTASSTSRSRDVRRRGRRRRSSVMADLCLDEFTDHGHCGVLDRRRPGRQRRDARALRRDGAWRWPRPGSHVVGPERDDGRPGRRRSGRRSTPPGTPTSAILAYAAKYASAFYGPFREAVESSLQRRPAHLPAGPGQRPRGAARGRARRRRGRRHRDGQAGDGLPRRASRAVARRPSTCRSRPTRSPASTRWSRRPRRSGWIDREPRDPRDADRRSAAPAPTIVLTYWAAEVAGVAGSAGGPTTCAEHRIVRMPPCSDRPATSARPHVPSDASRGSTAGRWPVDRRAG